MGRRRDEEGGSSNGELGALIDSATTSPADALDVGILASIKRTVRLSDDNVRLAFHSLMDKLKHKHSQVRYLALLVTDELFTRSKLFRTLLVHDFETFMLFSVGYRSDCPLPPPVHRATILRAKSMEILEKWNDSFGPHYKPLRLGYEYLKNTLHLQFPNLRQAAAQAEQQRKEREARSRGLVLEKFAILKQNFPVASMDIQQTLKQLDECFEILGASTKRGDMFEQRRADDEEEIDGKEEDGFEELGANSLRHALAQAACQAPITCETLDNQPVFDTVRDLCRLIINQHVPTVQNWMSILMRVDTEDRDSQDLLFKRIIDLRNQLSSAKAKSIELGIDVHQLKESVEDAYADDEIIWEEDEPVDGKACGPHETQVQVRIKESNSTSGDEKKPKETASLVRLNQENDSTRENLLEEAPTLPWGSYLDRWGAEHEVPVNQRGLLLESHWGKVDFDALLPADKVAEMNMRASYYVSAKAEIPPCLAPLKNGGLCQRRDIRVCPLHGPIKPRDSHGKLIPLVVEDGRPDSKLLSEGSKTFRESSGSVMSDKTDFMKEILAKAITNARAQDAIELTKKRERKLQAKRNREHNAAVLREVALANTPQGLGEALGEDLERYGGAASTVSCREQKNKRAKASLKAMLQPKPTAKDRLAERLLNSRANEATVRVLMRDEDAAYREAFLNQW